MKAPDLAAQAVRFYRALADAIEADPGLAPTMFFEEAISTNAQIFRSCWLAEHGAEFINAACRLLNAQPTVENGTLQVEGEIEGVPVRFQTTAYGLPTRTVVREVEVEEYVLDGFAS